MLNTLPGASRTSSASARRAMSAASSAFWQRAPQVQTAGWFDLRHHSDTPQAFDRASHLFLQTPPDMIQIAAKAGVGQHVMLQPRGQRTSRHAGGYAQIAQRGNPLRLGDDSRTDLATPTAARRLLARIGNAALEACGASTFSLADYKSAIRASPCWHDAVEDASRRIGSPTLRALVADSEQ